MRWQRRIDGGAAARAAELLAAVREEAAGHGAEPAEVEKALARLGPGLTSYAEGPWPRRATLFLEQRVRHRLTDGDGFTVELALRVDRVARYRRQVAILDFKTVPPHALELAVDSWQLRTYALAAPELLGVEPTAVRLFLVDLRSGGDIAVPSTNDHLRAAAGELLRAARGIANATFGVEAAPGRPCWACGFRLTCPSSLAPGPPRRRVATPPAD